MIVRGASWTLFGADEGREVQIEHHILNNAMWHINVSRNDSFYVNRIYVFRWGKKKNADLQSQRRCRCWQKSIHGIRMAFLKTGPVGKREQQSVQDLLFLEVCDSATYKSAMLWKSSLITNPAHSVLSACSFSLPFSIFPAACSAPCALHSGTLEYFWVPPPCFVRTPPLLQRETKHQGSSPRPLVSGQAHHLHTDISSPVSWKTAAVMCFSTTLCLNISLKASSSPHIDISEFGVNLLLCVY